MELSVPPRPIPTERVCASYDKLRQDIVKLISLQKVAAKKVRPLPPLCDPPPLAPLAPIV